MTVASLDQHLMARKGTAAPAGGRRHDAATPAPRAETALTAPPAPPAPRAHAQGVPARFSLRLNPAQHRRLRVAAACHGVSMQALITAALDHYLADVDDVCACVRSEAASTAAGNDPLGNGAAP